MKSKLKKQSIELLKELISITSFSGEEDKTANLIQNSLENNRIATKRKFNNIYVFSTQFDSGKPTLLLNSHHDTVRPSEGWHYDPFEPVIEGDKLVGLGSNDAGASLVSLMAVFQYFYNNTNLNHNLILALTAEEENSGINGIRAILPELGKINLAIVGEPTEMNMATAEKGLMVLRCEAIGRSGHAARETGENAIYKAMDDIFWIRNHKFQQISPLLGSAKMTVTMINAGTLHNVIPDRCGFTVDIRSTDICDNEMILEILRQNLSSDFAEPSLNLRPSCIPVDHTLVKTAKSLGIETFGSPTLSDQTYISAPSVKIGPGRSERSHTANEFIYLSEIEEGIEKYIELLECFLRT
jgi:acetylornithine deacetylase